MNDRPDDMTERDLADALARPRAGDANWRSPVEEALAQTRDMPQRGLRAGLGGLLTGGLRFATAAAAAAVAVVLAVVAVNLVGLVGDRDPTGALPSPIAVDAFVVARAPVPADEPVSAIVAEGSLWVGTLGAQLHQLDPLSGDPIAATLLPGNVCGPLTATTGAIWVVTCPTGPSTPDAPTSLVRVDTATGDVTATVQLDGHAVRQPAVLGDTLWIIENASGGVLRPVALGDATAGAPVTVGLGVSDVTAAFGSLWLSAPRERVLVRFDPTRGELVSTIRLTGRPGALVAEGNNLWIALTDTQELVRVDPRQGVVTATLPIGSVAVQLAVAESDIWALTGAELIRIDTADVRVVERLAVGAHSVNFPPQFTGPTYAMALGDGVWFIPPRGEMIRLER